MLHARVSITFHTVYVKMYAERAYGEWKKARPSNGKALNRLRCRGAVLFFGSKSRTDARSVLIAKTSRTPIDIRTYVCSNIYATTRRKKRQARTWPWVLGLHMLE